MADPIDVIKCGGVPFIFVFEELGMVWCRPCKFEFVFMIVSDGTSGKVDLVSRGWQAWDGGVIVVGVVGKPGVDQLICINIQLCREVEFIVWFVVILMSFDMPDSGDGGDGFDLS